jgi:hypothetical protein
VYIQADAKQLEWRTPVMISRDPVGIEELLDPTIDIHKLNQNAFELPTRLISKTYLFRTIFRGSGWAFANDPDFSHVSSDPDYWDGVNERFYKKYKGIDQWHKSNAQLVAARQPIVGPTGRRWLVPMQQDYHGKPKIPWTTLANYPVQGTGADIMCVARVSLANRLKQSDVQGKLVSTVHDSLVADVHEKDIDTVARMMYSVFDDLPKNFKKLFDYDMIVPFPCEVKVGDNLADMEELLKEKL